jgi:hypothetical protein
MWYARDRFAVAEHLSPATGEVCIDSALRSLVRQAGSLSMGRVHLLKSNKRNFSIVVNRTAYLLKRWLLSIAELPWSGVEGAVLRSVLRTETTLPLYLS